MKVECKKVIIFGLVFSDFVTLIVLEVNFRGNREIFDGFRRIFFCDIIWKI